MKILMGDQEENSEERSSILSEGKRCMEQM
jgi:hypothetical protein